MKTNEDIKKLQESFAACHAELKKLNESFKAKADGGMMEKEDDKEENCSKEELGQVVNLVYNITDNIYRYIGEINRWNYEKWDKHLIGHLPAISGSDKMNKVLKKLELDGDYVAEPKVIRASRGNYIIETELPKL